MEEEPKYNRVTRRYKVGEWVGGWVDKPIAWLESSLIFPERAYGWGGPCRLVRHTSLHLRQTAALECSSLVQAGVPAWWVSYLLLT